MKSPLNSFQATQSYLRTTSHMQLRPVTIALQALLSVEKAELVQVRFALRLRDQWSKVNARWM